MTTVYFVRHAEPDYNNHDDISRPLTLKGKEDSKLITQYLETKQIDVILSSPFVRAFDTVQDLADKRNMEIIHVDNFRERKVDSCWIDDFTGFSKKQWEDFDYKLSDGECLKEVQNRNVSALNYVLEKYENKNIVVGSHGTALSTIINYYDNDFQYKDFNKIKLLMPWLVKFTFKNKMCKSIEKINLFTNE